MQGKELQEENTIDPWGVFGDVVSPHLFKVGGLQIVSAQYQVDQMGTM